MSMSVSAGALKSEINVTPLVDVVLVLLIIFMVVTPMLQVGYSVDTPPEVKDIAPVQDANQVILRIDKDGSMHINKEEVPASSFPARLQEVMKNRKMAFFAADGDLTYGQVADFLDLCRQNGAQNLGIVFEDLDLVGTGAGSMP